MLRRMTSRGPVSLRVAVTRVIGSIARRAAPAAANDLSPPPVAGGDPPTAGRNRAAGRILDVEGEVETGAPLPATGARDPAPVSPYTYAECVTRLPAALQVRIQKPRSAQCSHAARYCGHVTTLSSRRVTT